MRGPRLTLTVALAALGALPLAAGCRRDEGFVVSAAVSLREPLEELRPSFLRDHRGATLELNLGGSGDLARQIVAGAPADVFIAASDRELDDLDRAGLVLPGTRRVVAANTLVVVVPPGAGPLPARPEELLSLSRVAIGNPRTVPAGEYARQWLAAVGLWDRLAPRLILTEDVRQTLDYVARGEVDAGVVYATDAPRRDVRVALRPDPALHRPIRYPGAVLRASARLALGRAFLDLLAGPAGEAALTRHGFGRPDRRGAP
jgi:molybdate transport system substrate-binding protein